MKFNHDLHQYVTLAVNEKREHLKNMKYVESGGNSLRWIAVNQVVVTNLSLR